MEPPSERIADLLVKIKELGISYHGPQRATRKYPWSMFVSSMASRLREIGIPFDRNALQATRYAFWMKNQNPYQCVYCGDLVSDKARARQIDHIIPLDAGGMHIVENVAPSCARCNRKKWHYMPDRRPKIPDNLSVDAWLHWVKTHPKEASNDFEYTPTVVVQDQS